MTDPRHRLYRPVPGERLLATRPVVERAFARGRVDEPRTKLPEPREPRFGGVRALRPRREPGPYVPKLIRLIRRRFGLRPSPRRERFDLRFERPDLSRAPRPAPMRAAVEALPPARLPRPTDVHLRPEPRRVPPVEEWLDSRGRWSR